MKAAQPHTRSQPELTEVSSAQSFTESETELGSGRVDIFPEAGEPLRPRVT